MSVVSLVILLESVGCVSVLEDWGVEGVEAPAPGTAEAQVMGAVATVHVEESPLAFEAILLDEAGATVGHHHIAKTLRMLMAMTQLMVPGIVAAAGADHTMLENKQLCPH